MIRKQIGKGRVKATGIDSNNKKAIRDIMTKPDKHIYTCLECDKIDCKKGICKKIIGGTI